MREVTVTLFSNPLTYRSLSVKTRGSCSFEMKRSQHWHTQMLNMHSHINAKCKAHQSIIMKLHPQTQHLKVAFSWFQYFLHFIAAYNKRDLYATRLQHPPVGYSLYHKRKIYAVLVEHNGPSNIMLGLGRREWQPLHSSPSSTDHIGASICLEYNKL